MVAFAVSLKLSVSVGYSVYRGEYWARYSKNGALQYHVMCRATPSDEEQIPSISELLALPESDDPVVKFIIDSIRTHNANY